MDSSKYSIPEYPSWFYPLVTSGMKHLGRSRYSFGELECVMRKGVLRAITKLGKSLGELDVEIDVPEDIEFLGIKKGKINLQRFFYWNVLKCFYRDDYDLDEMNHINFDWFAPKNAHRQSPEEVQSWCRNSGLDIVHKNVQEAGITIVARKI